MQRRFDGVLRLRVKLQEVMARHAKIDLDPRILPRPTQELVLFQPSHCEALFYNGLVAFVRTNLLLTTVRNDPKDATDCILGQAQTSILRQLMYNLRISCNSKYTIRGVLDAEDRKGTLDMLIEKGHDAVTCESIGAFMDRVVTGEPTPCQCCNQPLLLLLITPCAHLICFNCLMCTKTPNQDKPGQFHVVSTCQVPSCMTKFSFEELQLLQPGFGTKIEGEDEARNAVRNDTGMGIEAAWQVPRLVHEGELPTKTGYLLEVLMAEIAKGPFKAILFSQFERALVQIGAPLYDALGEASVSTLKYLACLISRAGCSCEPEEKISLRVRIPEVFNQ